MFLEHLEEFTYNPRQNITGLEWNWSPQVYQVYLEITVPFFPVITFQEVNALLKLV